MPPFAFPPGSAMCWSSRISRILKLQWLHARLSFEKKISSAVKRLWSASTHFSMKSKQGLAPSLGQKIWCVPALINSGTAALSVELPPDPHWTITQGEVVEKCEFDSLLGWWIAVFFLSLLPISTFILQLICQGQSVIFHLAVGLCLFAPCFFLCICTFLPQKSHPSVRSAS